jgi:starvation-inducible DNA-binding protein
MEKIHELITKENDVSKRLLFQVLDLLYMLAHKTQNYHWNVVGPNFQQLHELFGTQYNELVVHLDATAERLRFLSIQIPFVNLEFSKNMHIPPIWQGMVEDLLKDHLAIASVLNIGIAQLEDSKDEGTLDMLIQQLQFHEKNSWFLKSHLG